MAVILNIPLTKMQGDNYNTAYYVMNCGLQFV